MNLTKNFSINELTKSQTAERKGIDNTPSPEHQGNLQSLCMHVLQPIRDHFSKVVSISSGYRSPELCTAIGSKITSQHAKGEAADFEIFGICNKAEKLYRPTIAGRYDWSPKLAQGIKRLSYWRHRIKHNSETPVVQKLGRELNILYTNLTKMTLHQQVNESYINLKKIQKEATQNRQQHLSELAEKYARQHNIYQNTDSHH